MRECERQIKEQFFADMSAACMQFICEGRMAREIEEFAVFRSVLLQQNQTALFAGERRAS